MRNEHLLSDRRESSAPVLVTLTIRRDEHPACSFEKQVEIERELWETLDADQRLECIAEEQHHWAEQLFDFSARVEGADDIAGDKP